MLAKVCRRQMGIAANHAPRFPRTHLLNDVKRCAALNVPAGPRVPKIVPAKVLDACSCRR